jgi:hypothetical protein
MRLLRLCRLALSLSALLGAEASAQTSVFTSPLPTGVRLDPVGDAVELGSLPLNVVAAPSGDKAVVVLSGWREQGMQIVDLKTRSRRRCCRMVHSTALPSRRDGHTLYVSGGNTDGLFIYAWKDGTATLTNKFGLTKAKTAEGTGTSYPAGLAVAPNGRPSLRLRLGQRDHLSVSGSP